MNIPTIKTPITVDYSGEYETLDDADGFHIDCEVASNYINGTEAALKSLSETLRYSSHPIVKEMVRLGLWREDEA